MGACPRKRPTCEGDCCVQCASNSAAAHPHIRPWQRPMPTREKAFKRFNSSAPDALAALRMSPAVISSQRQITTASEVNAGVSGDTTAGGLSRLDWSLTPNVDALMVTLGGNDMLRGLPPEEARANLSAILEGAKAKGLPVFLVGMEAPGNYGAEYKAAFDAIYADLAAEFGATLYPFFFQGMTEGNSDPAAMRPFMLEDGIHPNAKGVAKIVADLGPALQAFLAAHRP